MTDEELIRLRKKIHAGQSLSRQETWKALDAITALRTQLAEAREKALREAIEAYPKGIGAILALIEAHNAQP